jgi:hypothetical protein
MAPFNSAIAMTVPRIDDAILAAVGERWIKVAMVIAEVEKAMNSALPSGDERLQVSSDRIESLVGSGSLASQGNVKNWRFSEIRRTGKNLRPDSGERQPKQGNIKQ